MEENSTQAQETQPAEKHMDKDHKKRISLNKTWILIAVLVLITGGLLALSLSTKNPIPEKITTAKVSPAPHANTILEFSDSTRPSTISARREIDININTNGDKVTLAQLELTYNPRLLTNVDIAPGSFFTNPKVLQKNVDNRNGRVSYWIGLPEGSGFAGQGQLAVVTFTKVGSDPAQIIFMPKTSVQAKGKNQSVLKDMISGFINNLAPISKSPSTIPVATRGAR